MNTAEREINLIALCVEMLKKWRRLLLTGLAAAVVLVALQFVRGGIAGAASIVKYLLTGFVLGAFLACMVVAVIYIFSDKLKKEDSMREIFGVSELGCIEENEPEKQGWIDKKLDQFSRVNPTTLSRSEQLELITTNICLHFVESGAKTFYVASSVAGVEKNIREIVIMLRKKGVEVRTGKSFLTDAMSLVEMCESDAVILVEKAGVSRYETIAREITMCKEHEKKILGMIVIE